MTSGETNQAVWLLWRRQSVWSQAADRLKASIARSRLWTLILTVAAAVLGTASAQLTDDEGNIREVLALGAAVALALVPIVSRGFVRQAVQDWTRLRSVSEALKARVYAYLAGVTPFREGDRAARLLAEGGIIT